MEPSSGTLETLDLSDGQSRRAEMLYAATLFAVAVLVISVALLREHPDPSEKTIREFMQGNICRCGTYPRIVVAIQRAAAVVKVSGA